MTDTAVLEIKELDVRFETPRGSVHAVRSVSLGIGAGECLAVVGESGSGKSQLFLACLGLLASGGRATGSARFEGRELIRAEEPALDAVRGTQLTIVFQDPMNALTPHLTVGRQLAEVVLDRGLLTAAQARKRSIEVLDAVGLPDSQRQLARYPHEFSGGQRQRIAIAMALMPRPRLLVADEPTTALDVTVQAQMLEVLRGARARGVGLVLITHDLGVVAGLADRVAVMYAGQVVELADTRSLFAAPAHPYTAALLASVPRLDDPLDAPLAGIEGQPPGAHDPPAPCAFAPRCPRAFDRCRLEVPALRDLRGRLVACHSPLGAEEGLA
jgi:oligopeptide transport system ATP-binding protein